MKNTKEVMMLANQEYFLKGDFQFHVKTNKLKSFGFWLNTDFSVREAGETPYFESE